MEDDDMLVDGLDDMDEDLEVDPETRRREALLLFSDRSRARKDNYGLPYLFDRALRQQDGELTPGDNLVLRQVPLCNIRLCAQRRCHKASIFNPTLPTHLDIYGEPVVHQESAPPTMLCQWPQYNLTKLVNVIEAAKKVLGTMIADLSNDHSLTLISQGSLKAVWWVTAPELN
jgi:hypothetical protein